jgi:hypothetical protein
MALPLRIIDPLIDPTNPFRSISPYRQSMEFQPISTDDALCLYEPFQTPGPTGIVKSSKTMIHYVLMGNIPISNMTTSGYSLMEFYRHIYMADPTRVVMRREYHTSSKDEHEHVSVVVKITDVIFHNLHIYCSDRGDGVRQVDHLSLVRRGANLPAETLVVYVPQTIR